MMKIACKPVLFAIMFLCLIACNNKKKLFEALPAAKTGIHFSNNITENDSINPIDLTNIYNGGGVGIGDFNNDGLPDIYFTGNRVTNKLYLNRGHLQFEDITTAAGVDGAGRWCRGVAVVDINNDGLMDMYVCVSMEKKPENRKNLLYINQGINEKGIPVFKEMAEAYGLADTTHSTMAAFFDYDNDGDLDMYLTVNQILPDVNPSTFKPKITDGSFPSTGRLYRNDWNDTLKHPVFKDVTRQAGLTIEGYGHGATIADINKDGWKDIFVTNDFVSNDLLYINNHDGTFTDKAAVYFKHTSANGMGQDIIDINNDGLSDIIELDMNPEDNYRKKMMLSSIAYQTFQNSDRFKYQYQYVRNGFQVNQGPRVNANDSIGDPIFSDEGYFAGIAETDWSWCPLVADFDNDGFRDIIVTNGYPKDITDHDFVAFRQQASNVAPKSFTLQQIPQVKLHKYAFQNNGNLSFKDVSKDWGFTAVSFSNGAAYADLDNDGDLDIIINNINDEASVYENKQADIDPAANHYLSVELTGDTANINGLGAWIELYYGKQHQAYEQTPYRGYLSTMPIQPHFGLGTTTLLDSVVVKWPDGKKQVLEKVAANQTLHIHKKDAALTYSWTTSLLADQAVFKEISAAAGITYIHQQEDFVDFNIQKLLPHKFSEYAPALAAGDINGDGRDDIVVGGNDQYNAVMLLQQPDGKFAQMDLLPAAPGKAKTAQDIGLALLDADGDGDLDICLVRGGYEQKSGSSAYSDILLVNDGTGHFTIDSLALPQHLTSKSCVRAIDYDNDGDLDLFIGGRVNPWNYPQPVSSYIYRNDSRDGHIQFTDVTEQVAPALHNIGLVCDALFTDFNNDGWVDCILAGEWMPITFLQNEKGTFKNVSAATGIGTATGWWNSIVAGDFDNDGDMDYIVGNLGQNSFYKASPQYPVAIYAKDFDNNGSFDAFPAIYLPASQEDTIKKLFPAHTRDDAVKQVIGMRSRFQNYKSYAQSTIDQLFTPEQLTNALILHANNFNSCYCKNDGNGRFTLVPLPAQAQLSVLNGMVVNDFDGDGNLDLFINTNDYGTDVTVGRYDALNGLLLKGDGKGGFTPQTMLQSGIYIPGNGKALVQLKAANGRYLVAAAQNRGPLKLFELKRKVNCIPPGKTAIAALLHTASGHTRKQEFYHGSSFLSQSASYILSDNSIRTVTVFDLQGKSRNIVP